jgi:hypothetical protein
MLPPPPLPKLKLKLNQNEQTSSGATSSSEQNDGPIDLSKPKSSTSDVVKTIKINISSNNQTTGMRSQPMDISFKSNNDEEVELGEIIRHPKQQNDSKKTQQQSHKPSLNQPTGEDFLPRL